MGRAEEDAPVGREPERVSVPALDDGGSAAAERRVRRLARVQGQRALEAMALPEANKRWCQEKYIAATFGVWITFGFTLTCTASNTSREIEVMNGSTMMARISPAVRMPMP